MALLFLNFLCHHFHHGRHLCMDYKNTHQLTWCATLLKCLTPARSITSMDNKLTYHMFCLQGRPLALGWVYHHNRSCCSASGPYDKCPALFDDVVLQRPDWRCNIFLSLIPPPSTSSCGLVRGLAILSGSPVTDDTP